MAAQKQRLKQSGKSTCHGIRVIPLVNNKYVTETFLFLQSNFSAGMSLFVILTLFKLIGQVKKIFNIPSQLQDPTLLSTDRHACNCRGHSIFSCFHSALYIFLSLFNLLLLYSMIWYYIYKSSIDFEILFVSPFVVNEVFHKFQL